MSSLYPSLEDFKYDTLSASAHPSAPNAYGTSNGHLHRPTPYGACHEPRPPKYAVDTGSIVYPSFSNYLDSDLRSIGGHSSTAVSLPGKTIGPLVAPLSGYHLAHRVQPSNAIRCVILCKDDFNKIGLRVAPVQGGVFIVLVNANSPSAMAGLRFGDQILEINDRPVAGYSMQKVHDLIRRGPADDLRLIIRDRPLERMVTLHKDSDGHIGFGFKKHGKIMSIQKGSSAARNGLLINHNIVEVNGQNVVALSEGDIHKIIDDCGDVVIVTVMPTKIYEELIKETDLKLLRKEMDHSSPLA